jgi:hypothetical protein
MASQWVQLALSFPVVRDADLKPARRTARSPAALRALNLNDFEPSGSGGVGGPRMSGTFLEC